MQRPWRGSVTGAFRDPHRARKDVLAPEQELEGAVKEIWKVMGVVGKRQNSQDSASP